MIQFSSVFVVVELIAANKMRIRELPYMAKRDVCKLLEINGCFHELGSVHMQFEDCFLQVTSNLI